MAWREYFAGPDTLSKILSSTHPSHTKILALLITYITEVRRTFCKLEKFISLIKFLPNCDIACLVYVKSKLIRKILTLLQQTWNRVAPLSSHKLHDLVLHSLSSCSFHFLVYVRHFLNHIIVFLAPPFAQILRQPSSSLNGSAGPAEGSVQKFEPTASATTSWPKISEGCKTLDQWFLNWVRSNT